MCFSAPASFIASGGLALLGGSTLAIAKKEDKILAAIPLMFAVQQAFEGVQWLYINAGSTSAIFAYGFLLFALIIWPAYVPAFVYKLDKKRRGILKWFMLLGTAVALYFAEVLLTVPLTVGKVNQCIGYGFYFPFKDFIIAFYIIAILGSLLISSKKIFRWYGVVIAFFAALSWYFYTVTFTSVWCFFAAIVSSMFFFYVLFNK